MFRMFKLVRNHNMEFRNVINLFVFKACGMILHYTVD